MADKRAFAKFDVGYLDNPKMLDVLDASSNAILMHFASVLYCAQHLTDGLVASKAMQRKTGGTDADAQILIENGLWHTPGHDCESCPQPEEGKVYVHDFLEHNRDAAEAKRVSDKRREAAQARWNPDAKSNAKCIASDGGDAMQREREREKESLPPSAGSRKRPERPLPADWQPNDAHTAFARTKNIFLEGEAERFKLHAQANDRRLRDWDAGFRMWLTKARPQEHATSKNPLWD